MTITVALSMLLMFAVRERYKRLEAGQAYAHRNEGVAAVLSYYQQLEESVSPSGIVPEHQRKHNRSWSVAEHKDAPAGQPSPTTTRTPSSRRATGKRARERPARANGVV